MRNALKRQRGVGNLLLVLVLLAGAGGASFWLLPSARLSGVNKTLMNTSWLDLLAARQALLAYATDYAQLYGGTGAGPGHLPCPDSDIRRPAAKDSPALIDGPNPPCGRGSFSTGWLPRQVTIDAHRYVIQAQQLRSYRYTVATGYINNPINRVVNSQSGAGKSVKGRQDVVATISTDSVVYGKHMQVVIYRKQLIDAAQRAVAAWLTEALQRVYLQTCADESVAGSIGDSMECRFTSTALLRKHSIQGERYFKLRGQDLLSVLVDPMVDAIDRTPVRRHWFVRNRWYEEFELRIHRDCLGELSDRCQFVIGTGVLTDGKPVEGEQDVQTRVAQVQADITSDYVADNGVALRRMQRIDWVLGKPGGGE